MKWTGKHAHKNFFLFDFYINSKLGQNLLFICPAVTKLLIEPDLFLRP